MFSWDGRFLLDDGELEQLIEDISQLFVTFSRDNMKVVYERYLPKKHEDFRDYSKDPVNGTPFDFDAEVVQLFFSAWY